jgi:hypothetical protein
MRFRYKYAVRGEGDFYTEWFPSYIEAREYLDVLRKREGVFYFHIEEEQMPEKSKAFNTIKVIDPHKNMPDDIKRACLDGIHEMNCCDGPNNDTFIWWTVGDYQHVLDPDHEDYDEDQEERGDQDLKKVDDWMLENGLKKGERVLVLYWW